MFLFFESFRELCTPYSWKGYGAAASCSVVICITSSTHCIINWRGKQIHYSPQMHAWNMLFFFLVKRGARLLMKSAHHWIMLLRVESLTGIISSFFSRWKKDSECQWYMSVSSNLRPYVFCAERVLFVEKKLKDFLRVFGPQYDAL